MRSIHAIHNNTQLVTKPVTLKVRCPGGDEPTEHNFAYSSAKANGQDEANLKRPSEVSASIDQGGNSETYMTANMNT